MLNRRKQERNFGGTLPAGWTQRHREEAERERDIRASALTEAELLAHDKGNRIIRPDDVNTARLGRRAKIAHLRFGLNEGKQLTYKWLDLPSRNGDYDEIRRALLQLFGRKLEG
jgi:hypothetical protein